MRKGKFIVFEGSEGSGKSTQAQLLASYLTKKNKAVVLTYEPGATPLGKKLRRILLSRQSKLAKEAEIFLFASDRIQHLKEVIIPALRKNKIVISDRYQDSTFAYQAGGRKIDGQFVELINNIANLGIKPDLTIFLDLPVEEGLKRLKKRQKNNFDRFEKENLSFHKRVRRFYLKKLKKEKRVLIISGMKNKREIHDEIVKKIEEIL